MRGPLSRPGQDEYGTSQTSIWHQPPRRRAMREYAVAPIHAGGVALRHVGPRDATWVPPSILTKAHVGRLRGPFSSLLRSAGDACPLPLARLRAGRVERVPSLPYHRPRMGARRLRPARPWPARAATDCR
jgi:hypothetical protein